MTKKVTRIIEDISINRFVKEVIRYARKYPKAKFNPVQVGDDKRAEDSFMFSTIMEYEEEE